MILPKHVNILQKNADTIKIKGVLVLNDIVSEITYVCVLTYKTSLFYHNSNEI